MDVCMLRRRTWFFSRCLVWGMLLLGVFGGRAWGDESHFVTELSERDAALQREKEASLDELTVRELNRFHQMFLGRAILPLPAEAPVQLAYGGIVQDAGNIAIAGDEQLSGLRVYKKQRMVGSIGDPLTWDVVAEDGPVFTIWLSVRETTESVTKLRVVERELWINLVGFDKRDEQFKEARDDLGGHSILEVISLLERGPSDLEGE